MATFTGDSGDNVLFGTQGPDSFFGLDGNDTISAGIGDAVDGGAGTDTLSISFAAATSGVDADLSEAFAGGTSTVAGASYTGLEAFGIITGSAFADIIDVGYGAQAGAEGGIHGGDGDDALSASNPVSAIGLFGDGGNDTLSLGDSLVGMTGSGGDGDDWLYGGTLDVLMGDAGNDVLLTVEGQAFGGDGDDVIQGESSASAGVTLDGGDGNDDISGGYGSDTLRGGDGNDVIDGSGNWEAPPDEIEGGAGDDTISGAWGDRLEGGDGIDVLNLTLEAAQTGISLNLDAALSATGIVVDGRAIRDFERFDTIIGSYDNDVIVIGNALRDASGFGGIFANWGDDSVTGGANADVIWGEDGDDTLTGNDGDDTLDGGLGDDRLDGGAGIDTASYASADAGVRVDLNRPPVAQNTAGGGLDQLISIENLVGGEYDDDLRGDGGANALSGGDGDDSLRGSDGDDTLAGGEGDDLLDGGNGSDTVTYAAAGAAVAVTLGENARQETGGAGRDTLFKIENLVGSAFADRLAGSNERNRLAGGDGDDTLEGGRGDDTLDGGAGQDVASYAHAGMGVNVSLAASGTHDTVDGRDSFTGIEGLLGSAYADTLAGDAGDNWLDGGDGIDTLTYAAAGAGVRLTLARMDVQQTGGAGADIALNFENLTGSAFADTLGGTDADNVLSGGAGIDTVTYADCSLNVVIDLAITTAQHTGGAGIDLLTGFENAIGSAFADILSGTSAANALDGGDGDDSLIGGDGNDTLAGGRGDDTLAGGAGTDTASYADAATAVTVKLAITAAQNTIGAGTDTLTGIEHLIGSAFGDSLQGNDGANNLTGGDGDDTLLGGLGDDYLLGAGGRDTASYITAKAGVTIDLAISVAQNTVSAGMDRIVQVENLRGSAYGDTLQGNAATNSIVAAEGNDTVYGFAGNDTLTGGTGLDTLYGGDAQDSIQGGDDADTIWGEAGLDNIKGDAGNDTVHGGADNDSINGGTGNDILYGEAGRDILIGDTGADRFVYTTTAESPGTATGRDQIRDFSHAQSDLIDLSAIDAVTGGANNAFAFIGTGAFTGVAGQLNTVLYGSNWIVQGDINGDKIADISIQVTSAIPLVAADFIL